MLQASPERVAPLCQHAAHCGGCQLQQLNYAGQLAYKEALLQEQVQQSTGLTQLKLAPYLAAPEYAFGYRRRARLSIPAPNKHSNPFLGFRAPSSNTIIPIHDCKILHPTLNQLLPGLQKLLSTLPTQHDFGHIELLLNEQETQLTATLVLRLLKPLSTAASKQWQEFSKQYQCDVLAHYQQGFEVVAGITTTPLTLGVKLYGQQLAYGAGEFIQVNPVINEKMIQQALDWLHLTGKETVLELFSGFGNFSIPLALHSAQVIAVEVAAAQVARGRANAALAACDNLTFLQADLSRPFNQYDFSQQPVDVLFLDPPRTGAADVVADLSFTQPQRILYISCHPATFARDAATILRQGYQLEKLGLVDMFPQTAHGESMALFTRVAR